MNILGSLWRGLLLIVVVVLAYLVFQPELDLQQFLVGSGTVAVGTVLGPSMLVRLAIPTGIDGAKVFQFQLRGNLTAEQAITKAAAAIGAVNEELAQRYSGLWYITDALYAYYRQGNSGGRTETPEKVEGKPADPVHGQNIGHMLPLKNYEDALGWTPLYMRDAPVSQLDADVAEIADRWRNKVQKDFLTRALHRTENVIGSAGYDVPWVKTGGSVDYVPPQYKGKKFTAHTHFLAVAGTTAADVQTLLNNLANHLREHGHTGRLVALVSDADIATYASMTDFVKLNPQQFIIPGGNTSSPVAYAQGEVQGMPGELFGYLNGQKGVVELRYDERMPTGYIFMTKSYGQNNPKNGIAIRRHPTGGFGLVVDPQLSKSINPELESVLFKGTHGVGVNERTNGVAGRFGNASYADPDID
jgi:hypothetical protein